MEQSALVQRLSHLPVEPNPVLLEHARQRADSLNNCSTSPTRSSS
jgi:hypothetical protein